MRTQLTMPSPKGEVLLVLGNLRLCQNGAGHVLLRHPRCWGVNRVEDAVGAVWCFTGCEYVEKGKAALAPVSGH